MKNRLIIYSPIIGVLLILFIISLGFSIRRSILLDRCKDKESLLPEGLLKIEGSIISADMLWHVKTTSVKSVYSPSGAISENYFIHHKYTDGSLCEPNNEVIILTLEDGMLKAQHDVPTCQLSRIVAVQSGYTIITACGEIIRMDYNAERKWVNNIFASRSIDILYEVENYIYVPSYDILYKVSSHTGQIIDKFEIGKVYGVSNNIVVSSINGVDLDIFQMNGGLNKINTIHIEENLPNSPRPAKLTDIYQNTLLVYNANSIAGYNITSQAKLWEIKRTSTSYPVILGKYFVIYQGYGYIDFHNIETGESIGSINLSYRQSDDTDLFFQDDSIKLYGYRDIIVIVFNKGSEIAAMKLNL